VAAAVLTLVVLVQAVQAVVVQAAGLAVQELTEQ
jgi:hypothetical protein